MKAWIKRMKLFHLFRIIPFCCFAATFSNIYSSTTEMSWNHSRKTQHFRNLDSIFLFKYLFLSTFHTYGIPLFWSNPEPYLKHLFGSDRFLPSELWFGSVFIFDIAFFIHKFHYLVSIVPYLTVREKKSC